MTRLRWLAVCVLCGCQGEPVLEVSLGQKAFEVKDAVFFSFMFSTSPPTTLVVFGDQQGLCQAFEDPRNVCNAMLAPDVHDGFISTLSRPVGVTRPLGWLVMRSATEGPALVVPDGLGLATPGASFTMGQDRALRSVKNRAVIDHLVVGDSGTFSFESELSDGRAFRGRVEASWCPALEMVRRHNESLSQSGGINSGPSGDGFVQVATCGNDSIEERCSAAVDGVEQCTCRHAGVTSTCSITLDPTKRRESCCNLRFGD